MISARERLAFWLGFPAALRLLNQLPRENYDLWAPLILRDAKQFGPLSEEDCFDLSIGNDPEELLPLVKSLPPFLEIPK